MSKDIWTNKQQAYLDKKFDAIDQRFKKLENQVKQNADGINQIIQILARNGMR